MSGTSEGGSGGKPTRSEHIVAWMNNLPHGKVPKWLNGHRDEQGLFAAHWFDNLPHSVRHKIAEAYNSRKDPGPAFADWNPNDHIGAEQAGNGPGSSQGGPNNGPGTPGTGGGGPGPQNNGPGGNHHRGDGNPGGNRAELAAEYGWSLAFLNHHPELKQLFNQAVKHTWTPERFVAELRDTQWFQQHSASVRQFMVNKVTDPASWQADLNKTEAHIRNTYGSLFGQSLSGDLAQKWAIRAMKFGWSEEQINDHLVNSMNFRKEMRAHDLGGTAAQTLNQMRAMAADYGVDASSHWYARQMERVLKGNDTMDGVLNTLKDRAKSRYEAFADQIDAGKTMSEIADPYRQSMAQLLEMNPGQVKLTNNMIQRALTRRVDGKTQPLSIGEFEDQVRKDPRWMHTQQANDQFKQTAYGLLQSWGVI